MTRADFRYRVRSAVASRYPGAHHSRSVGDGLLFRERLPFDRYPDARRIDLRASLTDPMGRLQVRLAEQPASLRVHALLDLSGSMAYGAVERKLDIMGQFIEALAASVHRTGDSLGIIAAADRVLGRFCLPPVRWPGPAHRLARSLRDYRPGGTGARGLLDAAARLPARRGLVFLVSDCHFPLAFLDELMRSLTRQHTVPLVIWDETEALPGRGGLARLIDPETGDERSLVLRPALRARLAENIRTRRSRITALFRRYGREPLFLCRGFDADLLSRYFEWAP